MNNYVVTYPLYVHVEAENAEQAKWRALSELIPVFTKKAGILDLMDKGIVDIESMPADLDVNLVIGNEIITITEEN